MSENLENQPQEEQNSQKEEKQEKDVPKKPSFKERISLSASILGTATRAFWIFIWNFLWVFLFGISLNIGLYIFSSQEVNGLTNSAEIIKNLIGYVTMLGYFVIFPIIFFLLAQRQGIKSAVASVANKSKELILSYFVDKFFDFVQKNPDLRDKLTPEKIDTLLQVTLPKYLKNLDNMQGILKRVFKKFTRKIDFQKIMIQAKEHLGDQLTLETLKEYIVTKTSEKIPVPLLSPPSLSWIFMATLVNFGVFAAIKILFAL
jgi:hypothetical protein